MRQPMFSCPFCTEPAYRTRYMLWRHMHECIRKTQPVTTVVGIEAEAPKTIELVTA